MRSGPFASCQLSDVEHLQDKNKDNRDAAEAKFKEVSEAFEVS